MLWKEYIIICCFNVFLVSRWKILFHGKHFWLRSIGSSAIGELIFTVVAFLIEFTGLEKFHTIVEMIVLSYVIKIIFLPIAVIPSSIATHFLKKIEYRNHSQETVEFNPFKISIT